MRWLMTPLDRHADDGFGAMVGAFHASAKSLLAAGKDFAAPQELPACFLLRHAAELFLKSMLVVTHRAFMPGVKGYPVISVEGKPGPFTKVHEIGTLYAALIGVLTRHESALKALACTVWLPMPRELDEAVAETDLGPKSANQPIAPEEIFAWDKETQGPLQAFVVLNRNEEIVEAFHDQTSLLGRELRTLQSLCEWLDCYHIGLRTELANGR